MKRASYNETLPAAFQERGALSLGTSTAKDRSQARFAPWHRPRTSQQGLVQGDAGLMPQIYAGAAACSGAG